MPEHADLVVVGAGHAGLAVSHELTQAGVSHVVLERGQVGQIWLVLETSAGAIAARTVVLATGAYQRPARPAGAATLPAEVLQLDLRDYRNPAGPA